MEPQRHWNLKSPECYAKVIWSCWIQILRVSGNNPYVGYDSEDADPYDRFFETSQVDPRLPAMERVIDIEVNGDYKIYPFTKIAEKGVLMDRFKDLDFDKTKANGFKSIP